LPEPEVAAAEVVESLWKHGDFLRLWAAQTTSAAGDQFTGLAIPLIAVLTLHATAGQMGILTAVGRAPFLLVSLFAGVWVDRLPRRPILVVADLGRALILLSIPLAAFVGVMNMPQLYAVALLVGLLSVFFDISYQAILPALVSGKQLMEGNSRLEATRSVASLAGPSMAGFVIQFLSAPVAIILDSLSFFVSAGIIGTIRRREPHREAPGRQPMLAAVREGLAVVFGNRLLASIAACTGTVNFSFAAVISLYILFATRDLGLSPSKIGLIFSVGNVSGLVGALTAGRLGARLGIGRIIVASGFLIGAGWLPLVFATPRTAFSMLVLAGSISSFSIPVYNINQVSLRQAITPHRLQGRMNATMRFLVMGTMPLGGLVGGALGDVLPLRQAIAIAAAGGMVGFLWVLLSPVRSLRAIPESIE